MQTQATQAAEETFEAYGGKEMPLGAYASIVAVFAGAFGTVLFRALREDRLPERVSPGDLLLMGVATHKLARLISRDTVTSPFRSPFTHYEGSGIINELQESPRGKGIRRALGELVFCPQCMGQWVAAALVSGYVFVPRLARTLSTMFASLAVADFLHLAYTKAAEESS